MKGARVARLVVTLALMSACGPAAWHPQREGAAALRARLPGLDEAARHRDAGIAALFAGEGPGAARARLARADPRDRRVALATFVAADLDLDEVALGVAGAAILARSDLHQWPAASLAYVLLRLTRAPVRDPLGGAVERTVEAMWRADRLPLEAVAALRTPGAREDLLVALTPCSRAPYAAYAAGRTCPDGGEVRPRVPGESPPPGAYRLRGTRALPHGTPVLVRLRSRNPLRVEGIDPGTLSLNEPNALPRTWHHLIGRGRGGPLGLTLYAGVPDPDLTVAIIPLTRTPGALTCPEPDDLEDLPDAWACAWLSLATGAEEARDARVWGSELGPFRLLRAAAAMERAGPGRDARIAFLDLSTALELSPELRVGWLLQARWYADALEWAAALRALDRGQPDADRSPTWELARAALWEAAGLEAEADGVRARLAREWPALAAEEGGLRLPWEERALVDASTPRAPDARNRLATASLAELSAALAELNPSDRVDLAHLIGRPPAWLDLRTPLNDILTLARTEPANGAPATLLLAEAIVNQSLVYVHRALRVDTEEGVRRHGEWSMPASPLLLKARAIKSDHSLVLPESHGASSRHAFSELEVGDVVEVEWIEELAPDRATQLGERLFPFQDGAYRTARTCFAVTGPETTRPGLAVEEGALWLFEKAGRLSDPDAGDSAGEPYAQWCSRGAPAQPVEPAAVIPEHAGAYVRIFPLADEAEGVALAHEDLWRLLRADDAIVAAARGLRAEAGGARDALVDRAWRAVAARVREDIPDAFASSVAETWRTGRGNRAALLTRLLIEAGLPARLALVNPLARDEGRAGPRFTLAAYPTALVWLPGAPDEATWLDPSTGDEPEAWLPAARRDRPAWTFGFPGPPAPARSPAEVLTPDLLRMSLRCEHTCRVRLEGSGEHRRWIERQAPAGADDLGAWLAGVVSALLPVEGHEDARTHREGDARIVEGRVHLRRAADGSLRLAPLAYGETLLTRTGGSGVRKTPLLLDADLNLVVEARFEGLSLEAPVSVHERCPYFELRVDATEERGATRVVQRFSIRPQVVPPDLVEGLRQNLTRIARPPAVRLRP